VPGAGLQPLGDAWIINWPETWAFLSSIGTTAAAAATAVSSFLVYRTLRVMHAQRAEMQRQREADLQPYVHVDTDMSGAVRLVGARIKTAVRVAVRNVGKGPALSVCSRLRHPWIKFVIPVHVDDESGGWTDEPSPEGAEESGVLLLEPHGEGHFVGFAVGEAPTGQRTIDPATIVVEYRDLLGRWWATELLIHFGGQLGPDGFTADGFTDAQAVALDQEERVYPLPGPRIYQDRITEQPTPVPRRWWRFW
jgi:hypothetical protein